MIKNACAVILFITTGVQYHLEGRFPVHVEKPIGSVVASYLTVFLFKLLPLIIKRTEPKINLSNFKNILFVVFSLY